MIMKKKYVTPGTSAVLLAMPLPLASNSIAVYDRSGDPVVSSSEQVFSRRNNSGVWGEEDEEENSDR